MNEDRMKERLKEIEVRWTESIHIEFATRELDSVKLLVRHDVPYLLGEVRRLRAKEATLDAMVRENEIRLTAGAHVLSSPTGCEEVSKETVRMDAIEARLNVLEGIEQERKKLTRAVVKESRMGKPTGLGRFSATNPEEIGHGGLSADEMG